MAQKISMGKKLKDIKSITALLRGAPNISEGDVSLDIPALYGSFSNHAVSGSKYFFI